MPDLNYTIGNPIRRVTINSIEKIKVTMPDNSEREKICFTVEDKNQKQFNISDVWVEDHKGNIRIQGLWFTLNEDETISPASSLAKLMRHYEIDSLNDFEGVELYAFPDKKDFLVLTACDAEKIMNGIADSN